MRIGILTFHRAENFGAVLQVYALSEYLKSIGHDPQVIDYRCKSIEHQYDVLSPYIIFSRRNKFKALSQYLTRLFQAKARYSKKNVFNSFRRKYLILSKPYSRIVDDLGYDAYITGSDQVWNPGLTGGFNKYYFLDFPMHENAKRISYAASSEKTTSYNLSKYRDQISSCLNKFDAISVREEALNDELRKYTSRPITTCLDPTFLIPAHNYKEIAILPNIKNYILVYHLSFSIESYNLAKIISGSTGKQIVEVFAKGVVKHHNATHIQLGAFDPCTLLGLIINADTVITTSFHGLALSINLHKEVWAFNKGGNTRLKNLLTQLGLEERLLYNLESYNPNSRIDYEKISNSLKEKISTSKEFLLHALSV